MTKSNARKEAEARAQAIANRAARRSEATARADAIAASECLTVSYTCPGCGVPFKGERGLASHQSRKFIAGACWSPKRSAAAVAAALALVNP
jgi:hypothetical protein